MRYSLILDIFLVAKVNEVLLCQSKLFETILLKLNAMQSSMQPTPLFLEVVARMALYIKPQSGFAHGMHETRWLHDRPGKAYKGL